MRKKSPYALQSVDRALVLVHLLRDQGALTVSDAAKFLGVGQSTAHRLLTTLTYRDFAIHDDNRCYRPGPAIGVVAGPRRRVGLLRRLMRDHLSRLRDLTGETVNLSVRVGGLARIVEAVESTQPLHVGNQLGTMLPVHKSAVGMAELAWLPEREVIDLVDGLEGKPKLDKILLELATVRRRGYALNFARAEEGVGAVGVALRRPDGTPIGAVAIAMPTVRFQDDARRRSAEYLMETAETVRPLLPVCESHGLVTPAPA
jgi:IclR family acetate operon transcriptional repressor